jgi:hypothetical protein
MDATYPIEIRIARLSYPDEILPASVEITNYGDSALDISSFPLQDESAAMPKKTTDEADRRLSIR